MSSANLATVFLHSLDIQQAMMEGHSLDHALERDLKNVEDPVLRAAIQAVSYDTVRHLAASWKVIEHFANRPPAQPVTALLETAIARMIEHPDKDFVTVDQAVKAARENPSTRPSAGFINAILRRFGRVRRHTEGSAPGPRDSGFRRRRGLGAGCRQPACSTDA